MMSALMFPIYLATNKIRYRRQKTDTEGRQSNLVPREASSSPKQTREREANLTHSNLQISKCLCIIIRSCYKYINAS